MTHIIPREKKAVSPNDWLIKLYSEHSAPIVLISLRSVPQAFEICLDCGFMSQATYFVMSRQIFDCANVEIICALLHALAVFQNK